MFENRSVYPSIIVAIKEASATPTLTTALQSRGVGAALYEPAAVLKQVTKAWSEDRVPSMGAALAFYTTFSLAPLLLIVMAVAGLVFGEEAARGQIQSQLRSLMGEQGAGAVQALLASVHQPAESAAAAAVGGILLLVGATTVFGELQDALDRIWRANNLLPSHGWWLLLRNRLLSFGMILAIGFLLMVSLMVSAALASFGQGIGSWLGEWVFIAQAVNTVLSFVSISVMFALIYKYMPRVHVHWKDVWIGAVITAVLFTVGKALIGLYLGRSSVSSGLGALAHRPLRVMDTRCVPTNTPLTLLASANNGVLHGR